MLELKPTPRTSRPLFLLPPRLLAGIAPIDDPSYLKEVLTLKVSESERLYEFILNYLSTARPGNGQGDAEETLPKGRKNSILPWPARCSSPSTGQDRQGCHCPPFAKSIKENWQNYYIPSNTVTQAVNLGSQDRPGSAAKLNLKMSHQLRNSTCGSCYVILACICAASCDATCGLAQGPKPSAIGLQARSQGRQAVIHRHRGRQPRRPT